MAVAEIVLTARDQTRAAFASVQNQLRGIGKMFGGVGGAFAGGAMITSLLLAFKRIGDAAEEMRNRSDLTPTMRRNVDAVNAYGSAWERVKGTVLGIGVTIAGSLVRGTTYLIERLKGNSAEQARANTDMRLTDFDAIQRKQLEARKQFADQAQAEWEFKQSLLDVEDRITLAVMERARLVASTSARDIEARKQILALDKQIVDLAKQARAEAERAAKEAIDAQIEEQKQREEFSKDMAATAGSRGQARGEAVDGGFRAVSKRLREERDTRNAEQVMVDELTKAARFDAGPNVNVSRKAQLARLALQDIDQARKSRQDAEAAAREQARLQIQKDAIPGKQLDELRAIRKGIGNMGLG